MFGRRHHAHTTTVAPSHHHTTTTRRRGLFSSHARPVHTTHRRQPVVHHQKRHVTLGDKLSGALLKLKGTLTHRPGQKAAGTRRMHGTDGRGSHRHGARLSSRRKYRY